MKSEQIQNRGAPRRWLPWALIVSWFAAMAGASWYFEFRPLRPFDAGRPNTAQLASAEAWLRGLAPAPDARGARPVATLVHVYQRDCRCNRYTAPHVAAIESAYAGRGVRVLHVTRVETAGALAWLRSTPAALVFDGAGRLRYAGPFSDAALCGASGRIVERVLDQLERGEIPTPREPRSRGCFCDDSAQQQEIRL